MNEFEELLRQHKNVLERFVKYKVQDQCDAEDLIQETCLAAYMNFETLKSREAFKSWLISIANNKCKDYYHRKAESMQIPLEELLEGKLGIGGRGLTEINVVRETLSKLAVKDKQILYLYFFENLPQEDISKMLDIPVGTVKSRLHYAKKNFKDNYPLTPKGEMTMKKMPKYMPKYEIRRIDSAPFSVKHEELPGMFIVPRIGEKRSFALYDLPDWKQDGTYQLTVKGNIVIHGVKGVEIESEYKDEKSREKSTIFAQLTDTHCRYLGGVHTDSTGTSHMVTFLDESFGDTYGIGKDNCGFAVERTCNHLFTETEGGLTVMMTEDISDICGRFDVKIGEKSYDTVRILDIQKGNLGTMLCEYYVDISGHTVLWRRFNKDDWAYKRYQKTWTEMHPDHEKMTINGDTYVHWYDCITDYIL
ncbi:MAG: sigma-70 family RNA polymerase sigma factor [Lachnospiraceae bacterium]|nr:sigma-70 family RNA polymerase sigma factor [Lachnospiraceae bacterium]